MDQQRLAIAGRVWSTDDPQLQDALARVHDTPERPRCLCVAGGVEMYVAKHRHYVVKRMPETGKAHSASCPSYEPEAGHSGLGELIGEAVLEHEQGRVELRVDFPWTRSVGRSIARGGPQDSSDVSTPKRRMSLRALMHYLFERAGFNRWSPAMEGRRNQGVLHKYLLEAAQEVSVKGLPLIERLFVPEPFNEAARAEAAHRRGEKLAVLNPLAGSHPLAVLLGEFKSSEPCSAASHRIWIKHLPDTPLLVQHKTWERLQRRHAAILEARDSDQGSTARIVMAALIRARRELTYEIDVASMMLTSEHWIPVEGVHELPLLRALVAQRRRFIKPLRYDAKSVAAFPNVLLLDVGATPMALHILSAFMDPAELREKERIVATAGAGAWSWNTAAPIPVLPPSSQSSGVAAR